MGGEVKSLLDHIREDFHAKVNNYRNVENYISNRDFELIFNEFQDKDKVFKWIMAGDLEHLKSWLEHNRRLLPLELWNVDNLRKEAANLKIPSYLLMNKGTLITTLKRRRSNA